MRDSWIRAHTLRTTHTHTKHIFSINFNLEQESHLLHLCSVCSRFDHSVFKIYWQNKLLPQKYEREFLQWFKYGSNVGQWVKKFGSWNVNGNRRDRKREWDQMLKFVNLNTFQLTIDPNSFGQNMTRRRTLVKIIAFGDEKKIIPRTAAVLLAWPLPFHRKLWKSMKLSLPWIICY